MISLIATIIGFLIVHFTTLKDLPASYLFAAGLFLGGIIVMLAVRRAGGATGEEESGEQQAIFVGNLAFKASRQQLHRLFSQYGKVHSTRIMTDRQTRKPRGYGFVVMDKNNAIQAIKALDGAQFMGRDLKVSEAKGDNRN